MGIKTVNGIVKKIKSNFPRSVLLNRPYKWCQNVENLLVKPLACGLWFHLSLEHFDVISMVDKSIDHGNLLLICDVQMHYWAKPKSELYISAYVS